MSNPSREMPRSIVEDAAESHLEWETLASHVHARLSSPAAQDRLRDEAGDPDPHRVLPRYLDVGRVRVELRALEGLEVALGQAAQLAERVSITAELGLVADVEDVVLRASKGAVLDVEELCAVADAVGAGARIAGMLRALPFDGLDPVRGEALDQLRGELAGIAPPSTLAETLERSLERGGEPRLADAASDVLGRLRGRYKQARRALVAAAERFLKHQGAKHALADNYWTERDGRVVVPVRSDGFSRGGGQGTISGIIHGASGSGQTLFVEPAGLVDDNNALREASTAVRAEERRILQRLSKSIGDAGDILRTMLDTLVQLDQWQARLRLCDDLDAAEPRVESPTAETMLRLPGARHPLMVLAGTDVVANDLQIGIGQGLVVSGPNAGGKTVALKTIGLCVMMAQAGLRVPAGPAPVVPLFTAIVTDVGDDQSIAANLSTFSAHIAHVLAAFEACAGPEDRPLVLLDEVAVGTDPDQGAALAEAILLGLADRRATQVVTTHYERLKLLASQDPDRFVNAAVGFDLDQLRPTFRVRVGAPGSSSALAVARRLGMPESVLDRAQSLLADARVRVDALLQEVEAERERLAAEREALQREKERLEHKQAALELREQKAEDSAAARRKKAHEAATAALRGLEDEIKVRRKRLRNSEGVTRDPSGVSDPEARTFARRAGEEIDTLRPATPSANPGGDHPVSLEVGERVRIVSLGTEGDVVSIKGDKVTVAAGMLKTTVSRADLRTTKPIARPRKAPVTRAVSDPSARRFFGSDAEPVAEGHDNVLDLRGVRADEALTMLEVFLDRSISDDREVIIVRHGYGSGALRKVVREHLPRLSHVRRHRPGLPIEGGDAVTVVWVAM